MHLPDLRAAVALPGLSDLPQLPAWRWLLGATAALLAGVAKTGIPGFGILAVPLMVIAVGDARRSAAWLLPLLCVADIVAVVSYRRHAQARRLFALLPWVLVGMAAGAVALGAPERDMRLLVAAIVLGMLALRWWRARTEKQEARLGISSTAAMATEEPSAPIGRDASAVLSPPTPAHGPEPRLAAVFYGAVAGFATTIANAAGPVMNLYLLARRLPKQEFVATGAWFFFVVNLCKLPVYATRGFIDRRSLAFDVVLVPVVLVGAGLGRTVLRRVGQNTFETLVYLLTVGAALLMLLPR
jgi:uncharacterized membrane protein YfcA